MQILLVVALLTVPMLIDVITRSICVKKAAKEVSVSRFMYISSVTHIITLVGSGLGGLLLARLVFPNTDLLKEMIPLVIVAILVIGVKRMSIYREDFYKAVMKHEAS